MADDIKVLAAVGDDTVAPKVATDLVSGKHYQKVKVGWGPDNTWIESEDANGYRLPVGGDAIGLLTDAAPVDDTSPAGLNGRLQRVSQRLTTLIGKFPVSLGQKTMANSLAVTLASDQPALPLLGQTAVMTMTVTAGAIQSNSVDTQGYNNMGLLVPAEFDGTDIRFEVSYDNVSFTTLYDITGAQVTLVTGAGRASDLPGELMAWRYFRLSCVTTQTSTSSVFRLVLKS